MAARGGQFSHPLGLEYVLLVVPASFLSSYSLSIVEFYILYAILTNIGARGDQFSHPLGLEVM